LDRPAVVIGEWQSGSTDGWRKELLDASRFAATAAPNRLMTPAELPTFLCGVPVAWVVARHDAAQRFPWLAAFPVAASTSEAAVWRIERGTATIAGTRNRHSAWLCSRDDIG